MWIIDRIARAWEDGKVRPGALTHPDGCGGPYYEDPPVPCVIGFDPGAGDGPAAVVVARPRPDGTIDVWPHQPIRGRSTTALWVDELGEFRPDASADAVVDRLNGRWPA